MLLFAKAAGRCQFDGCNALLLQNPLTKREGIFAQVAHVVAFSEGGPRARSGRRATNPHELSNLMLLCGSCHKEVDDAPELHPRRQLENFKIAHEARIRHVTGLGPDRETAVVIVSIPIGGQLVTIPMTDVVEALGPRYPSRHLTTIDLSDLMGIPERAAFYDAARQQISRRIRDLLDADGEAQRTKHVSLFALGPIPLLVHLGSCFSNKVATDLFQRHRDNEQWSWKRAGRPVQYTFNRVRGKARTKSVVLLLSLSGKVTPEALPKDLPGGTTVYELTLAGRAPSPTFLHRVDDLEAFRIAYRDALSKIRTAHPGVEVLRILPAVPAPIAVLCGRERLPKIDPRLAVYDYDIENRGWALALNTPEVDHG